MADASKRECHRCGRQFARLEHLQRHERSHTKEKPYSCSFCTKAFTRKDLLTRHNRIYHGQNSPSRARQNRPALLTNTIAPQTPLHVTESSTLETGNSSVLVQASDTNSFIFSNGRPISFHDQAKPGSSFPTLQDCQSLNDASLWAPALEFSDFSTTYVGDEFSNFVDTVGFPSNPFSPSYQPVPDWPSEPAFPAQAEASEPDRTRQDAAEAGIDELDVEATPWASRMPSVQPQDRQGDFLRTPKRAMRHASAQVSHKCRESMIEKLKVYSNIVTTEFILPSRHTLTCFMTGYVTIFNEHYPLIHIPTLRLENLSVELFLSIAALGAQYYWERTKGLELFHVARIVTYERLRGHALSNNQARLESIDILQAAQALILLIAVSTWSEAGKGEAFALRSLLEEVMHADAFNVKAPVQKDSWEQWKHYEEAKRAKLIAYCFFNLHTITFDVPPMMLYRDVDAGLACSEKLWRADAADSWYHLMAVEKTELGFLDAFKALFDAPQEITNHHGVQSPLSGHTLLQAIIQHIWLLQQAGNLPIRHSIASTEAANSVELALKRWRMRWETDHESSADTSNPDGPMPFTSRALLRLAYIRINIDSGSSRSIGTWNPHQIARSLRRHPPVQRNDKMTRAALHCAQGLGIPIKLGINFVAHTQVFYWSNQYALCSLECALLLTKWLEAVVIPNPVPELTEKEQRLLDFVVQLVNHTEYEAPRERLLQNNKHLSIIVLRLWAILFRPGVWEIVDLIGKSLLAYADLLEHGESGQT